MVSYTIVHYNVISLFMYQGTLLTAINAILATVVDWKQAIVDIDKKASRNKLIHHLIYTLIVHPSTGASPNPAVPSREACMHRGQSHPWLVVCTVNQPSHSSDADRR